MQPAAAPDHRPLQTFWRAVTQFDSKQIHWWMAARNAIGVALPLALGVALGAPGSGVTGAVGALNVAAADGVDAYRRRGVRMLTSSVLCGLAVMLGALCSRSGGLSMLLLILWAIAAGLLVCLGQAAGDLGVISLVAFIIYAARL